MPTISRRTFVQGLGALPLALGAMPLARAATPYVRYDLASPQGRDMLAIYANAVRRMQSYSKVTQLNWMWQWYTHFVRGDRTKADEIQRIWGSSVTSMSKLAQDTWDTCQSHSGQNPNNFLPWHRMFVYYFERIVRSVSGRSDFTLPYWDYTSDDPAKRGVVPVQFRSPDDPVFGVLYRQNRTDLANSGEPIQSDSSGDPMNISRPMGKKNYDKVGTDAGFCRTINSSIHGAIHVLVGNRLGMGTVPYSGNDPLFWVHHANIDRMWASWNRNGGVNPAGATWAKQTFVFGDAGGRVTAALKDFFDTDSLGYGYDAYISPSGSEATTTSSASPILALAATTASATGTGKPERLASARGGVELGARPVHVPLLPVHSGTPLPGATPVGAHTWLVLKDLHAWAQPEVLYHVYLTAAAGDPLSDQNYVGFIQFFDAEFHDHGHGAMATALADNYYSFDVTELLTRLAGRGNAGTLVVSLIPGGQPTPGGKPLVGTIELVRE